MAKLENYNGSVSLMAGITQKGGGDFAMVEANAVQTREDGTRLDAELLSLQNLVGGKSDSEHTHDELYYTEAEVDEKLDAKADASSIPTTLADLTGDKTHRTVTDEEKTIWNLKSDFSGDYNDLSNKPTIPSIVGLATESYVDEAVLSKADAVHAHDDKYYTESEIDSKLDEKADISSIPTGLSDLADDATHRVVTDAEKEAWNAKSDFSGSYNDLSDKPTIPSIEGLATTTYVDDQIADANTYTDDKIALLLNNSSEAVDSIMELATAMDENEDVVAALESAIGTKVDKVEGMGLSSNDFTDEEKTKLNSPVPTDNVVHGEAQELLSNIIETYILSIDYGKLLAFDISEIVFDTSLGDDDSGGSGSGDSGDVTAPTNAVLGYAVLGQMILG